MRLRLPFGVFLLGALLLGGCALLGNREGDRQAALDNFVKALRYQLYPVAASYFDPGLREPFLDQMEALKGLTVTDVRTVRLDIKGEGNRVDARLEMDYYLLPSATVRTLTIQQVWLYRQDPAEGNGFFITTPFPQLP